MKHGFTMWEGAMNRGLYIATTAMVSQRKRMDVVTNNLANATTAGYKEDTLLTRSFADMMVDRLNDPAIVGTPSEVGLLNTGIHVDMISTSFASGVLEETGRTADLALEGAGFFAVETPEGERYTRSGQFQVSASGELTTLNGNRVLGQNGPIRVSGEDFSVSGDGTVQSAAGSDRLRLVSFADTGVLRKEGNGLYAAFGGTPLADAGTRVRQGTLESSNVDMASQMVDMIEISRNHELNQRIVRMMDEKLGKSVSEIGRL